MELKFVEVTNGFNWGKFGLARFTRDEWMEPAYLPGAHERSLLYGRGWRPDNILVLDFQTGEGAIFWPGGHAGNDLDKHKIWVCPMYEPFLAWLYWWVAEAGPGWWPDLPRIVELEAPGALHGYRRAGPPRPYPRDQVEYVKVVDHQ
jgi:hypothetical protein